MQFYSQDPKPWFLAALVGGVITESLFAAIWTVFTALRYNFHSHILDKTASSPSVNLEKRSDVFDKFKSLCLNLALDINEIHPVHNSK